jgi:hypothetical protein
MRFYIRSYDIYRTYHHDGYKDGITVAIRKGFLHTYVNLRLLPSVEPTRVRIFFENIEMLLTALHKSPQRIWSDTDITELLLFRNKTILAIDLNAKHSDWNSSFKPFNVEYLRIIY